MSENEMVDLDPTELLEHATAAKEAGELSEAAKLFNAAGNVYMSVAEYEEALHAFETSLDLYRQLEDGAGVGDALYNIGLAQINLEKWDEAVKTCEEAVNLFKSASNNEGSADALYALALAKLGQGEFDEALDLFKKAQRAYKTLGNQQGVVSTIVDIGNAYAEREDWVNAEKMFKKALKIYQELDDAAGIADIYSLLGDIAEVGNNQKKAAEYFVEAAEQYVRAEILDVAREVVERAESKLWDIPKATRRRLRKRVDDIIDNLPEETMTDDDDEFDEDLLGITDV
ncbi:MAG: tetratricopeptide repeat protein [Candidatus Thorarchaeota archaeon]|nr:tetratricopeptide repeat protein [Candidatus Thorarchaeota archaeon]